MENNERYDYQIQRELNIRKIVIIGFIVLAVIAIIILISLYISKEEFRNWIDINVLRKDITNEDVATIDLNTDKNNQIFCYDKYVCILNDKNLVMYNTLGENISEIEININTALFAATDKYLAVAEKNGQEFCLISDKTYLWRNQIDGEILQIHVNKNGYVALVTTDTTYRSIITLYDPNGNQVLRNYLSSTRAVDVSISNDNQYLAFAELDTSGTLIQSNVKVISVEKAKTNPDEAIIYTYNAEVSKMLIKLQYQEDNNLICGYDDSIDIIKQENENELITIDDATTFTSVNLNNNIAYIKEETTGVFNTSSTLNILNTSNNQQNVYNFDAVAKEMYAYGNTICINIGTELYFINTSGMLRKKYTSNQEITNVMFSNDTAIVIYKDRVEIIDL